MTTRRDLIKLASALGLAGTIPTAAERIAAAHVLDQEVSSRIMLDPGKFAQEISLSMGNGGDLGNDWYGVMCPERWAEYTQARERLEQVLVRHNINSHRECGDYDGEVTSLALGMYDAGLRQGAAFENLRRTLVGETIQCTACWGTGLGRDSNNDYQHGSTCTTCGGTGTVAMRGA